MNLFLLILFSLEGFIILEIFFEILILCFFFDIVIIINLYFNAYIL